MQRIPSLFLSAILTLLSFGICNASLSVNPDSSIQKITSIKEFQEAVQHTTAEDLVVFDVDYVILTPSDLVARPRAKKVRRPIFKAYQKEHGKDRFKLLWSQLMLQTKRRHVEPEIETIIQELQNKGVHVIALTAIGVNPFGFVLDPIAFRKKGLSENGIHFRTTFSEERKYWGEESGFSEGIVFSGSQPKGEALVHYLEKIANHKPKRVFFIDDNLSLVESVAKACHKMKIPFQGFHYQAHVFEKDPEVSPAFIAFQIEHLHKTGEWLPDAKAEELFVKSFI